MNSTISVITDYRKWLLYSFDKRDLVDYYHLFNALKTGTGEAMIKVITADNSGITSFIISHDEIKDKLEINEEQRKSFLKYLVDNYFHTEDVEELVAQKRQQKEKDKNHHGYLEVNDAFNQSNLEYVLRTHPKETTYFNIKLVISILVYASLAGIVVYGIMTDLSLIFSIAVATPVIFIFVLLNKLLKGIFIGIIRGNSIRVTKDQFPEIYEIIEEQAAKLKIKELPEIYIAGGHFNAFVTRFSRSNILLIFSEVIETSLKGNYDVLRYVTAHELCHIKQKHLTKEKYLFPSRIIPFLDLAYSRGCEYTCDRVGYSFSPKGSVEGILIMTTGKEIHSKFNVELHIKDSTENEGFWTWFSEKFLTHPHLYKRLIEVKNFSNYN